MCVEEYTPGEISVAAPVLDFARQPIAAVNFSVPVSRWTTQSAERRLAPIAIETAQAISRAEGGQATLPPLRRNVPPKRRAR
jgi:DNA-binding IclR family transcriptional regulator